MCPQEGQDAPLPAEAVDAAPPTGHRKCCTVTAHTLQELSETAVYKTKIKKKFSAFLNQDFSDSNSTASPGAADPTLRRLSHLPSSACDSTVRSTFNEQPAQCVCVCSCVSQLQLLTPLLLLHNIFPGCSSTPTLSARVLVSEWILGRRLPLMRARSSVYIDEQWICLRKINTVTIFRFCTMQVRVSNHISSKKIQEEWHNPADCGSEEDCETGRSMSKYHSQCTSGSEWVKSAWLNIRLESYISRCWLDFKHENAFSFDIIRNPFVSEMSSKFR